jgi:HPt (histidine-containing phosphotransfer) domain-containing protein
MERVDGDVEFLRETITMLDEDAPGLLEEIQTAAEAGDAAALVKPAHALKGMLANFCAPSAESAARELEALARSGRLDGVGEAVERVEQETARLSEALHQFLRTMSE